MSLQPLLTSVPPTSDHKGQALGALLVLVAVVVAVWGWRKQRKRHRRGLAMQWEEAWAMTGPRGPYLAQVDRIQTLAHRGTKAWIVWPSSGQIQDAWFPGVHLHEGTYVVVDGNSGWGPHTARVGVFYATNVRRVLSADTRRSWEAEQRANARRRPP